MLAGTGAITATGNGLDNVITGNAGANKILGNAGADTIDGGKGNDTLTGGDGSDVFLRHSVAEGKDTIADFVVGDGGDVLDIADLLIGFDPFGGAVLADFVRAVAGSAGTIIQVDANGAVGGVKFVDVCVLSGLSTTVDGLLENGNLTVTDTI